MISQLCKMPVSRLNRLDLFLAAGMTTYAVTHGHGFIALALIAMTALGFLVKMKLAVS